MDLVTVPLTMAQQQLFAGYQPVDVCLLQGGWASGKTLASVVHIIKLALHNNNSTGLIVAPQIKTLRDHIVPLMHDMLAPYAYRYNQQTRVFRFPNGSRIYLRGLKNCDAITANYIWLEHANQATEDQFKKLLTQLKPGNKRFWLTSRPVAPVLHNPLTEAKPPEDPPQPHWLNRHFGPAADRGGKKPFRRICLNTLDNPAWRDAQELTHLTATHTPAELAALTAGKHPDEPAAPNLTPAPALLATYNHLTNPLHVSNGAALALFGFAMPRLSRYFESKTTKARLNAYRAKGHSSISVTNTGPPNQKQVA
jgi:hypothetical protein